MRTTSPRAWGFSKMSGGAALGPGTQQPQRAAMRDDDQRAGGGVGAEGPDAGEQRLAGFAAGGREAPGVGRPGIEHFARHVVPGQALPCAEIDLQQPWIGAEIGVDRGGETDAAAGGG